MPLDSNVADRAKSKLLKSYLAALRRFRSLVLKPEKPLSDLNAIELHDFRRSVRRLRYLRDLLLSRRAAVKDPLVTRLVVVQDALGEVQNRRAMRDLFVNAPKDLWLDELEPRLRGEEKRWLGVARMRLRRLQSYLRRRRSLTLD
ncbi:MAG: CHAD domain-containing protein [Terriglobales bacterium]